MTEDIKPEVIKMTQDTLGKFIKKPPLTDKLLKKPPFRFLHDIVTSTIKDTGFLSGLYTDSEMVSDNIKDRDGKITFLQKLIDCVTVVTDKKMTVRPSKIVAGLEPAKTNELLQAIGYALNKKLDSSAVVAQIQGGQTASTKSKSKTKDDKKTKEKTEKVKQSPTSKTSPPKRTESKLTRKPSEEKVPSNNKIKESPRSNKDNAKDDKKKSTSTTKVNKRDSKDIKKDKSPREIKTKEKDKSPRENKNKEKDKSPRENKNKEKDKSPRENKKEKTDTPKSSPKESETKIEKKKPETEPEIIETKIDTSTPTITPEVTLNAPESLKSDPSPLPPEKFEIPENLLEPEVHPEKTKQDDIREKSVTPSTSKKRSKKEVPMVASYEPEMLVSKEAAKEIPLRPKTSLRPPSVRPSSARPGAPRLKDRNEIILPPDEIVSMGKVNVIVENFSAQDEDNEETVVIEAPQELTFQDPIPPKPEIDIPAEKGHLVNQILEQLEESSLEPTDHKPRVEIEWESGGNRNREAANREMEKLRDSIQTLTRAANPLGKLMNFLQEDVDSMRSELKMWIEVNEKLSTEIKTQERLNEESIEPLKKQLNKLDEDIQKQHELISVTQANILRNEQKIKMLLTRDG